MEAMCALEHLNHGCLKIGVHNAFWPAENWDSRRRLCSAATHCELLRHSCNSAIRLVAIETTATMNNDFVQHLVALRRNHAAWLLLASRNAPLTLTCLQALVESHPGGLPLEDAVEQLTEVFASYANDSEFDTGQDENHVAAARRELRLWLKRGLLVERGGQIMATNPLQKSLAFIESLEDHSMTSTASRLATVQREIEELDARLSPNQNNRAALIRQRIKALETELAAVERGEFDILDGPRAQEGIREVYQLAVSLRADFRRVEDSYRAADLALRQRIISEKRHRGEVVDELLSGHETLVNTAEGQVFEGFHRQLVQSAELERMKARLRSILENSNTERALARKQRTELRELVPQLVKESERVIQARARSERDVRSYLTSGLADEQLKVGALLQEVLRVALDVDWQQQALRRAPGPLPPIAIAAPGIPVIERILPKEAADKDKQELDFANTQANPAQMDDEFWQAYQALDQAALFHSTLKFLAERAEPVTLASLADALPPTHDLETLVYWLAMAREAGINIEPSDEAIDLFDEQLGWTRYRVPQVQLSEDSVKKLKPEEFE